MTMRDDDTVEVVMTMRLPRRAFADTSSLDFKDMGRARHWTITERGGARALLEHHQAVDGYVTVEIVDDDA